MLSERGRRLLEALSVRFAPRVEPHPVRLLPRRRGPIRRWPWGWAAVAVVGSVSLFLMVEGAASGDMALALTGVLCWLLWRYWPQLRELGDPALLAEDDGAGNRSAPVPR
jgi:hypothetical protein